MTKTFRLTIAAVGETLFEGEVASVTLPGSEGVFTVLSSHEAFVSELVAGEAQIHTSEGTKQVVPLPRAGVAEVSSNQVTVLL